VQVTEVILPKKVSFPFDLSMLCANVLGGPEGEGNFTVSVYLQDEGAELEKIN
jgi:hypothetical protein